MFQGFKKSATSSWQDTGVGVGVGVGGSTIHSEINENNIDLLIRNVINQVGNTVISNSETPENTEKFAQYVRNFLDRNKRKVRNASFAKELTQLPTNNLIEAIEVSLTKSDNPLRLVVSLWHAYLCKKYLNLSTHAFSREDVLRELSEDIDYAKRLFTDLVCNLYRDWVKHLNNEIPIHDDVENEVVPELLTAGPEWQKVYARLEGAYARLKLAFNRQTFIIDPCFFEMNPYFTGNQLESPFPQTRKAIQKFCRESNMKLKVQLIQPMMEDIRQDIQEHQKHMIQRQQVERSKQIDVDNLVSCLECCLLLANEDITYHLELLKNFYSEDHLSVLQYGHFITSLEVAHEMLKERNAEGKLPPPKHPTVNRNSNETSSVVIHKNYDGFRIRMSSIRLNHTFPFAHCFQFRTLKWIRMLDINWVSVLSELPLKQRYEFVVKLHGTNNVRLGVYQKPQQAERLRNLVESRNCLCLCMRSGILYNRGDNSEKYVLRKEKIELVRISVDKGRISWWLIDAPKPIATADFFSQLASTEPAATQEPQQNRELFFHAALSFGAEVEIV